MRAHAITTQPKPERRHCKDCDDLLSSGHNWTPSAERARRYVCRTCQTERGRKWDRANAEYRRAYHQAHALGYRSRGENDEISRIVRMHDMRYDRIDYDRGFRVNGPNDAASLRLRRAEQSWERRRRYYENLTESRAKNREYSRRYRARVKAREEEYLRSIHEDTPLRPHPSPEEWQRTVEFHKELRRRLAERLQDRAQEKRYSQ